MRPVWTMWTSLSFLPSSAHQVWVKPQQLQIKSMIYLHCFITPVHQISVVMLNLEVKRKSKNNHLEKDKLPISGLVFRQSLKALEKMRPPASLCCWSMGSTHWVWFARSQHSREVLSSPGCGFQECHWANPVFQVLIPTFIPSMCYIFLECLLTTSRANSFSFG